MIEAFEHQWLEDDDDEGLDDVNDDDDDEDDVDDWASDKIMKI